MGYFAYSVLLLITLLPFHPISSQNGSSDLIKSTCRNTKYYDLCLSSLKSDSSSRRADLRGLAEIMVKVGITNATATASFLSSQMLSAANDTSMKRAVKECADEYGFANEALRSSAEDLRGGMYDYAYMHVMAAADYPNACRSAFRRSPGLVYPPEIAVREDGLKRICDVVLGIVDALAF